MQRFRKLGLFLLILAGAIVVGLVIMNRAGIALPATADLEYPELTDSDNAAFLYRAAWNELEATPEGADVATLKFIREYNAAFLARAGIHEELGAPVMEPDLTGLAQLLAEAEPAFALLRQVHTTKGCLFLQDHSPELVYENLEKLLETVKLTRNLANYMVARAFWESEQGDTDTALEWIATGLHLANDLSDETVHIGESARLAIGLQLLSAAQAILYRRPIFKPIPQALLNELDELRDRRQYGDSLRREGSVSEAMLNAEGLGWSPLRSTWQRNYLDALGAFIEAVEQDDHAKRTDKLETLWRSLDKSTKGRMKFLHHHEDMLIPPLFRAERSREIFIAKVDLLDLGLSLRAYEQTHGAFPNTLAELTPEYLAAIPEDPLNGKDYIYEKSDERVTVRSGESSRRGEIAFHLAPTVHDKDSP